MKFSLSFFFLLDAICNLKYKFYFTRYRLSVSKEERMFVLDCCIFYVVVSIQRYDEING